MKSERGSERSRRGETNREVGSSALPGTGEESFAERTVRFLAARSSRRTFLGRVGKWLVSLGGVLAVPSLPLNRATGSEPGGDEPYGGTDPTKCNYWRHCNLSGFLCADCPNGGVTTCPPGSELGAEFWYGCCEEPESGETYMIAYQDCCGLSNCGRHCTTYDQRKPYNSAMPSQTNDVLWCQSTEGQSYTCTVMPIIAEACTPWEDRYSRG